MRCKVCRKMIPKFEQYTFFYYCEYCDSTHDYEDEDEKEERKRKSKMMEKDLD